jgi:fructokinase
MRHGVRTLVLGEVLWDRFPDAARLGGAPLNFAVHLKRLGHDPLLMSALGSDAAGDEARRAIEQLGLETRLVQSTGRFPTGTATVRHGSSGEMAFTIERPAAYDAVSLTGEVVEQIVRWDAEWLYFGTLFPSRHDGKHVLDRLLRALPKATRFYDVNLRPGFDSLELVGELIHAAHVLKLNEDELRVVHRVADLPADPGAFCRAGCRRFSWRAACVTLGARGCVMSIGDDCVEAAGIPVAVVDTVGAGDAFAAAFAHGIICGWPVAEIASFANRAGARVAGVSGAIPDR